MKKPHRFHRSIGTLGGLALIVTAGCSGPSPGADTPPSRARSGLQGDPNAVSLDHPYFLLKLADPDHYEMPDESQLDSICGPTNRMQEVNRYDGLLGQPISFVVDHKDAVGGIETRALDTQSKSCTGTMISSDLFITANHCVGATITTRFVAFNYERDVDGSLLPQSHYPIVEVAETGSGAGLDYAILRLDGAPGDAFGWAQINPADPGTGELLTILQHASGAPKRVHVGHLAGQRGNYATYADIDTLGGSSGSGVLDSNGAISAIHTNGGCTRTGGSNSGVRMQRIAESSAVIQQLLGGP